MPYEESYADVYPPDAPPVVVGLYPGVYPWIARCLADSASDVDDAYFDAPIKAAIRDRLSGPAAKTGLATGAELYASLVGDDLDRVSEAIGHLVAADWQPTLATGGGGGELLTEATEQTKRQFASAAPQRARWRSRARRLLAGSAFSPAPLSPPTLSGANGPSRVERERLRETNRPYGGFRYDR